VADNFYIGGMVAVVAVVLWDSWRKRNDESRNLRKENWSSVLLVAVGAASLVMQQANSSGFRYTQVAYAVTGVLLYAGFVYVWNLVERR
jgi:hypothetical protein